METAMLLPSPPSAPPFPIALGQEESENVHPPSVARDEAFTSARKDGDGDDDDDDDDVAAKAAAAIDKRRKKEEGRRKAREIATERRGIRGGGVDYEGSNGAGGRTPRPRTRHGARNQHRHKHFARWLMGAFPELLGTEAEMRRRADDDYDEVEGGYDGEGRRNAQAGEGEERRSEGRAVPDAPLFSSSSSPPLPPPRRPRHVLDIACGKGELSVRLSMCHGLPVVAVDPRLADFAGSYVSDVVPRLPRVWQDRFSERQAADPSFVGRELGRRVRQLVRTFDDGVATGGFGAIPSATAGMDLDADLLEVVEGSCLMVGFHADGATEAVVDIALRHGKPFVVVPCCVFPRLFSHRYVMDESGRRVQVRTHDQFCRYLLQKDPRIAMEILPFEGRNVAIWWNGEQ